MKAPWLSFRKLTIPNRLNKITTSVGSAKDFLRLIKLDAFRLEMPDADHLAQQMM